jgi:hypothetical protein
MDLNSDIVLDNISRWGGALVTTLIGAYLFIRYSFNSKTDAIGNIVVNGEEIAKRNKRKRNLFLLYGIVFIICFLMVLLKHI